MVAELADDLVAAFRSDGADFAGAAQTGDRARALRERRAMIVDFMMVPFFGGVVFVFGLPIQVMCSLEHCSGNRYCRSVATFF